ncbi:MAG TPA: hypothetical protein VGL86_25305 [Polyangia bacterium]|jgi:hypothetical protein
MRTLAATLIAALLVVFIGAGTASAASHHGRRHHHGRTHHRHHGHHRR